MTQAHEQYDAIIIGVGQAGNPLATALSQLDITPSFNSTTIMEIDVLPEHLLILGGSYIGFEFAQLFRRLGSRVTILQRSGQLIPPGGRGCGRGTDGHLA